MSVRCFGGISSLWGVRYRSLRVHRVQFSGVGVYEPMRKPL